MYRALSKSRRIGSWWPGRRSEDSAWLTSRAGTEVGWCRIAERTITGGWREIGGNLAEGEGHESGWIRVSFFFHSWNRTQGEQSEEGVVEEIRTFLEDETGWTGAKMRGGQIHEDWWWFSVTFFYFSQMFRSRDKFNSPKFGMMLWLRESIPLYSKNVIQPFFKNVFLLLFENRSFLFTVVKNPVKCPFANAILVEITNNHGLCVLVLFFACAILWINSKHACPFNALRSGPTSVSFLIGTSGK